MIATDMLKKQHREVSGLFKEFEKAKTAAARRKIFEQIADALAIHASIEEKHFYPAVKKQATEDMLLEAVEEHLGIKRVIADLLKTDANDESFQAKAKVLKEEVEHHVGEEEDELFPKVEKLFDDDRLEEIAAAMQETADELASEGEPRLAVPSETEEPARI
jgi:hemerythrin superfamily protein